MDNTISNNSLNSNLFDYDAVFARAAYLKLFGKLASCIQIYQINTEKAYKLILKKHKELIVQKIDNTEVYANKTGTETTYSFIVLKGEIILELGSSYCEIYYSGTKTDFIDQLKKDVLKCTEVKKKPLEVNLISTSESGYRLNSMDIKRTKLDLSLYYNDDFEAVHKLIKNRLNKKKDKGIVLLHGMPGTGKTTYLRYLVGKLKKKVIFIPPYLAAKIASPELLKLLVNHPDSVLIIEDAENIIMQRRAGQDSSVSNLLNICDGLLSDFLNIQVICTFNSPLSTVDEALMREGRMIAKYEFKKLSAIKSQKLADKLGIKRDIKNPMSIAEITNGSDAPVNKTVTQQIGFKTTQQLEA